MQIRRGEKRYFERVEHVEGVRYELVLTGHAAYLERHVSITSQWVGGVFLALFLHIIGVIVQYALLRGAHVSVRIPYRSLKSTSVRRVPRNMTLLLGIALTIVVPLVVVFLGGFLAGLFRSSTPILVAQILAVLVFFGGCIATVAMLIRYPRTALAFGFNAREYEYHSLGDESLVHEIIERVLALQDRGAGVAATSASDGASAARAQADGSSPAPVPAPIPGPKPRR
jgi:hypothetical protein